MTLVPLHVLGGAIAIVSGLVALYVLKGGRMCVALFIAAASFFLGPVSRIPEPLRIPALRMIPLVVLVTIAYWLWRYRRKRISRSVVGVTAPEAI